MDTATAEDVNGFYRLMALVATGRDKVALPVVMLLLLRATDGGVDLMSTKAKV